MHIGFPVPPDLLLPADIVHTQSESVISRGIRAFTGGWASHTAAVADTSPATIVEAQLKVAENPLTTLKGGHAVITRWPGVGMEQRAEIVRSLRQRIGERYPVQDLLLQAIDHSLFGKRYIARRLSFWRETVCTPFVVQAYREQGFSPPYELDEVTPDDLLDFAVEQGHEIVWASSLEALVSLKAIYGKRIAVPGEYWQRLY